MEWIIQAGDWLLENESAISALAGLGAIIVILFVPARALWRKLHSVTARKTEPSGENTQTDRPSIIVLPFDALSGGASQSATADGLTEDLTTLLAKMSGYHVFARNTAFTFKGGGHDVQKIGQSLNVRYAIEGSIRPAAQGTRVTVQLIETAGGTHLWADNFDQPGTPISMISDVLVNRIGMQLGTELTRAEATRAQHSDPNKQSAWELYQQAKGLLASNGWNVQNFEDIAAFARRAIKADPSYAPPQAYLSLILALGHWVKLVPDRQAALEESLACAEKALELAPNSSEVLGFVGCAFSDLGYSQRGIPIIEKAIELDPGNAQAFAALGAAQIVSGDLDTGIAQLEHAIAISPQDASFAPWSTLLSFGLAMKGEHEKSLESARSACKSDPRYFPSQIAYARALAKAERPKEAQMALEDAKRQYPPLDREYITDFLGNWVNEEFDASGLQLD
jgi:adenylate cyclase